MNMSMYAVYRPYCCPCPGASCKWQGNLEQVMPHLMQQHKSITTLQGLYFATQLNHVIQKWTVNVILIMSYVTSN